MVCRPLASRSAYEPSAEAIVEYYWLTRKLLVLYTTQANTNCYTFSLTFNLV